MKNSRFFLIPLLLICGVLLLSLLLRWITSPSLEETSTEFQTQAAAPAYTQWHLPEGAKLRLGKGHIRDIKSAPNGTQFIVATSIGIWLYDAHTGSEIARLNEKPRDIRTIAFSSDGKKLISADSEGEVQMWDIFTTKLLSTFQGPRKITNSVSAVSVDRIKLANKQHGNIHLWEFGNETLQPIVTDIKSDSGFGHSTVMALSPNAMLFATAMWETDENHRIRVWDANTGNLLFVLEGHTRWIRTLAFSLDSKTLASGDERQRIRLWNMDTGNLSATLKVPTGSFHALAFSPNGKLLASGRSDGTIQLWNASTEKQGGLSALRAYVPTLTLKAHKSRVSTIAFSSDGKMLITASLFDKNIRAWDTTTGNKRFVCSGHLGNPLGLVFSETDSTFTSVYRLNWNSVQLEDWDVNTKNQLSTRFLNVDNEFAAISPDGKTIVAHEYWQKEMMQLWDVNTRRARATLKEPSKKKRKGPGASSFRSEFTFSPDSTIIASGRRNNVVRLWDATARQPSGLKKFFGFADTLHPRLTIQGHPVHVRTLAFSPDGKMLAGGSNGGHIHLWDAHTGAELFTRIEHSSRITALAFSPDGRTLASGGAGGEICFWNTADGTKGSANILKPRATVSALLFSPDGKILVSGSGNGILQLWETNTGRLLSTHAAHTNPIRVLLFSPDGKTLASGSNDATTLLWNWEILKRADDR